MKNKHASIEGPFGMSNSSLLPLALVFAIILAAAAYLGSQEGQNTTQQPIAPENASKEAKIGVVEAGYVSEEQLLSLESVTFANSLGERTVTAYCLTGTMANGEQVHDGVVANNELPFGTRVEIDNRIYVVADRMAKKNNGKFDIWMTDCSAARAWGFKKLEIYAE